jgi:shikimate dehydrogenase
MRNVIDRYAVVGNPIRHSKSPLIHSSFARETGQDLSYEAIEIALGEFPATVDAFRTAGGRGINITAPFKLDAYDYATHRSERARLARASNCLKFERGGVYAENFDGVGLVNDIVRNLGVSFTGRRVLLLGAGGAARGALLPFLAEKPAALTLVNRTLEKAHALLRDADATGIVPACSYRDLNGQRFDVVVNATSASLRGELPPVPATVFGEDALAYELVYGKGLTPFLRLARGAGVRRIADGVGMLVEQAAEAFRWWRGVRPETGAMIAALTVPLA